MPFEITIKKQITDQMVYDLLVTAREGGSNYWMEQINYVEPTIEYAPLDGRIYPFADYPLNDGKVVITHGVEEKVTLTKSKIKRGLNAMAKQYPRHMNDFLDENMDADTADVFLQCCVFGRLVYG